MKEPADYAERVRAYEAEGMSTSDAQGVVDAEINKGDAVSQSKHTPGPWHTDQQGIRDAEGNLLAESFADIDKDIPSGETEQLANARLIAAAPELLEACWAVKAYMTGREESYKQAANAIDKVTKAIAKAEGR